MVNKNCINPKIIKMKKIIFIAITFLVSSCSKKLVPFTSTDYKICKKVDFSKVQFYTKYEILLYSLKRDTLISPVQGELVFQKKELPTKIIYGLTHCIWNPQKAEFKNYNLPTIFYNDTLALDIFNNGVISIKDTTYRVSIKEGKKSNLLVSKKWLKTIRQQEEIIEGKKVK
jgi:hypothetical protein